MSAKTTPVTIDWLVKILIGVVGFFLAMTFFSVQQMAADITDLKTKITVIQGQYNELNLRLNRIEGYKN